MKFGCVVVVGRRWVVTEKALCENFFHVTVYVGNKRSGKAQPRTSKSAAVKPQTGRLPATSPRFRSCLNPLPIP